VTTTCAASPLDEPASLLHSVGRSHPDSCDPGVRLHCLAAADYLSVAGATVTRTELGRDEVEAMIRAAMAHLATLPAAMFAGADVLAAADAAQAALERLQDG
jgi:hypothetical protein